MFLKTVKLSLKILPDSLAFPIVKSLAARTTRSRISPIEQEALSHATRISYGDENQNVAWSWGSGPLIVFVHGWSGQAAQMAPLAKEVSNLGFRSVAIDVTGHGSSPGRKTDWSCFFQDISSLAKSLDENVFCYIGHSAGALTMMAARALQGIQAQRYVCISPPSHPFPPINLIQKILNPSEGVIDLYKDYVAEQFKTSWQKLETGTSFQRLDSKILIACDETDKFVPHTEGDKLLKLCPNASLLKTSSYSHLKILSSPELYTAVRAFLNA